MKKMLPSIPSAEITEESVFMNRRDVLRLTATAAIGAVLAGCPEADQAGATEESNAAESGLPVLEDVKPAPPKYQVDEPINKYSDATTYNNFYEF